MLHLLYTYKGDHLWIKILIIVLFVVDAFNSTMDIVFVYDGIVVHFGDVEYMQLATWYILAAAATTGVVEVMVQLFYAWRIHVVIQNWLLTAVVVALSLASGVGSWVATYGGLQTPTFAEFQKWDSVVITWLGCAGAADIIITVSLVWHFLNSRGGWKFNQISPSGREISAGGSNATTTLQSFRSDGGDNPKASRLPTRFLQTLGLKDSQDPPRSEVFVHVESHEMQDIIKGPSNTPRDLESEGGLSASSVRGGLDTPYGPRKI
ncbi:hypothetical protein NP233_g2734 [Leucocoprinus birnbaumii]|uniref:Uncharacterized protein n=1 Tax=Leucocoprinus birnbaumii TaxID=56174 RepID=A0AAD5W1N9_9AGAR|nr:hypothetical protein NP233_g2734 [Leucocoprinus birnbaumii]